MTDPAIFIAGFFVTLAVLAALGGLVWAEIQDGNAQARADAHERAERIRDVRAT